MTDKLPTILEETAKKPVPEAMSMGEVVELGSKYKVPQDRALFYFCYLTGARISEALDVTPGDIQKHESEQFGKCLIIRLLTRKNRKSKIRYVPVLMQQSEKPMVSYVNKWILWDGGESIFPGLSRTNAWNRLSKVKITIRAIHGKIIIPEYTRGVNPHYLRHCRLTHLVQHYSFNEVQLMRFAGWTNPKPAGVYVHLNWMDLAKVMIQASRVSNGGWSW